ncbi:MAG: hypothetical protein ACM3MG_08215 [Bacillota bacterium]
MKSIFLGRVKKWVVLALIGCFAYFVGYIWGQGSHKASSPVVESSIQSTK